MLAKSRITAPDRGAQLLQLAAIVERGRQRCDLRAGNIPAHARCGAVKGVLASAATLHAFSTAWAA
jgi:hypothetical protein